MSNIEFATTSNATAVNSQPEIFKEKINEWIKEPSTYDDQAQSSFAQSIDGYANSRINDIASFVDSSKEKRLRAIITKCDSDITSLKLKPSLIAKSLSCGTLGGLAAAQIATQITTAMIMASCATPAGWIGGTGTAVIFYSFDKRDQTDKIYSKALLDVEKTDRVAEKMLSFLEQYRLNLKLKDASAENLQLSKINADLNTQGKEISAKFSTATRQISTLVKAYKDLKGHNAALSTDLDKAQENIYSLDGDLATLQQENQNLRTDTATRIDEIQRLNAHNLGEVRAQSAANLASFQQMNRDLLVEMRAEFQDREVANALKQEDRERSVAAKQIVERGIEKALRQEQENKISKLTSDLIRKSAAFEVLQSEHDHMSDQIKQRFDIMTQTMSRNPTESSVSELLRSNDQQDASVLDSESNGDFIEVAQEM